MKDGALLMGQGPLHRNGDMDDPITQCIPVDHNTGNTYQIHPPTTPCGQQLSPLATSNRSYSTILGVRVKQQEQELESLTDSVNAVQRNFIRMSHKYAKEKKDHDELAVEYKRMTKEFDSLMSEKKLDAAVRAEFTELKGLYDALLKNTEQRDLEYKYNDGLKDQELYKLRTEIKNLQERYTRQGALLSELQMVTYGEVVSLLRDLEQTTGIVFSKLANELLDMDKGASVVRYERGLDCSNSLSINGAYPAEEACEESHDICSSDPEEKDENGTKIDNNLTPSKIYNKGTETLMASPLAAEAPRSPERQTRRLQHLRSHCAALRNTQNLFLEEDFPKIWTAVARQREIMQQLRSELDDAISQLKDREYREQEFEIEKLTCIKLCEDRVRDELSSIFQQNLQDVIQKAQNEKEMLVMKEAQLEEKVRIMQDSLSRFKTEAAEVNFANEVRVTALQVALEKHRDHEDELNTRQAAQKQREKQYSENLKEVIEENKKEMKRRESEWGQLRLSLLGQISNQQAKQQQDKKKYIKVATEIQRLKRMLSDFKSEVESEVTVMDQHLRAILVSAEQQAANVTARQEAKINSLEEEVLALSLYLSNEKREKDQIKMELDYKRDEIDSISVEMSSIKAKLVSVDVEQRICKEQLETKTNIATTSEISLQILMNEKESLVCRINELEGSSAKEIEGLRRSHQKLVNNLEYKNASISAGLEDQVGRITIERDEEANRRELQIAYLLTRHTHQTKIQSEILETVRNDCLGVVKKLQSVEESCESGYSCQLCLAILRQPLICAPCGHTFCRSCFEEANRRKSPQSSGMYCPECNNNHVTCAMPSKGLDLLVSKFEFRKRVLGDLMGVITNWGRCRLRQLGGST